MLLFRQPNNRLSLRRIVDRLDSCAASASSGALIPVKGINSTACRLPNVIVPVLSSSKRLTRPSVSMALRLVASTFRYIAWLMAPMLMAGRSPPTVIGSRQIQERHKHGYRTRGARGTDGFRCERVTCHDGEDQDERHAGKERIQLDLGCCFLSSGVFGGRYRWIQESFGRSRGDGNREPVERTREPAVTTLRSPVNSRMTGALSPVTADSSIVAMPSTISPSPGMRSPASANTRSPLRSWEAATI